MTRLPLLSILIWLPILAAVPLFLMHKRMKDNEARWFALLVSLVCLGLSVFMYVNFDTTTASMQLTEYLPWVPSLGMHYYLGVDGISMPLIALSAFTTVIIVLASWTMVTEKVPQYLATFLLMQGAVVGVFSALDAMLFYFFWEAILIPMYLSIGVWGMGNRSYAAIKFFLYTFFGSVLMLAVILYLHSKAGGFNIPDFYTLHFSLSEQIWIFFGFFLAFAVKVPMWPFHTWLPDAHTEAPTGGSVILAALMLKLGGYGFLRFSLPIVPDACHYLSWFMIILSLFAIVYIALVALSQTDMKKLIAYSSIAHMGFVTLGCFLINVIIIHTGNVESAHLSLEGAMVQMISHAFGSGAMFLAFGVVYMQMKTRNIKDFGGIATVMPIFTAFFILFAMSNVGLPGTSGFVGEFMVILSSFKANIWATFFAASSLVLGAAYTLWMVKRVFFGPVTNDAVSALRDVRGVDTLSFVLLSAMIILLGVYPQVLLRVFQPTISHLLDLSLQSRLL